MAIRDKFRRAVGSRKSTASSSSSSTHAIETASNADSDAASSTSSPIDGSSHTRTFTWRPAKSDDKQAQPSKPKTTKKKSRWTMPDPREKPFTEMNLRYQQMLGSYELTFGTSHPEQLWNPDGELSPGTSRQNSIDLGRD